MGEFSVYHWLIVLVVILILFGGRRIPELLRGFGEGVRVFRAGLAGEASEHNVKSPTEPYPQGKKD